MPRLADTLVEGTLARWLKQPGETVTAGEPLATIETDKITTDLPSPGDGIVETQLIAEGQTVGVDTPLARITQGVPEPAREQAAVCAPGAPTRPTERPRRRPTSVAARLLEEHRLELAQVPAAGARLTRADVLAFLEARDDSPGLVPLTPMRRAIATHMTSASREIPQGQVVVSVDLTRLVRWRAAVKDAFQEAEGASLTFTVLFTHALARQARPDMNIGVAVALEEGLIVPVLHAANSLDLGATARGVADLTTRARNRTLTLAETQGAHMTVSNVGSFGNLVAAPIVPLGQQALLGPGLVERRPLPADDGGLYPGWRCLLALVFDRRVMDDFAADRFLRGVADELRGLAPDAPSRLHH
jgi:pyruvate/2-oxoglutarate dehydrogenase complex dihydrolipoamide acyltransferase (E2) component